MIRRPARRLRIDPLETEFAKVEPVNKDIDDPNRVVLANKIVQAFR